MLLRFIPRCIPKFRTLPRHFSLSTASPLTLKYNYSSFDLQQEKKQALKLLDSIHSNTTETQLDFSQYQQHQLFQKLQRLELKKKLSSTHLIQSLNYLVEERYIHPVLYMLYPHIGANSLSPSALMFTFQKILAYKPESLPEVPAPTTIVNNQMLFFILCELYQPKKLIGWLNKVPFWNNQNQSLTVFSMAIFTLYSKMNNEERQVHAAKLNKAIGIIDNNISMELGDDAVSVLILALELNNPYAQKILAEKLHHLEELPQEQLCLVFTSMGSYSPASKTIDKIMQDSVESIVKIDWKKIKSITIMDMWRVLNTRTTYKGAWMVFLNKLVSQTEYLLTHKEDTFAEQNRLSPKDLVFIIETLDKHFINKKQLLHQILHKLQPELMNISSSDLVKLVKSMCIYVKLEEGYFMHLRRICDKRKLEFSNQETGELRKVYSRFGVLFSQPF